MRVLLFKKTPSFYKTVLQGSAKKNRLLIKALRKTLLAKASYFYKTPGQLNYNKFWKKKFQGNFFVHFTRFLIGGASLKVNDKFMPIIMFSKNNIDLFRISSIRIRFLSLYASFRGIHCELMSMQDNVRFMFASTTCVFAKLMRGAAVQINGLHSGNRGLSGRITATINIPYIPHYIFIPDIDEDFIIMKEAVRKAIAIIGLVSTDSRYLVDVPIFGNNKDFKIVVQTIKFILHASSKRINTFQRKVVSKRSN